ncbi:hypothetical protein [Halolamina litorea]|uniref:Uncharacterized protein n=1 Tax=Halolamina litorea TaxID=1515593 RepID=A0ABD6BMU3_9EURY|nr:hypothetical protein [Halolamina litorea]
MAIDEAIQEPPVRIDRSIQRMRCALRTGSTTPANLENGGFGDSFCAAADRLQVGVAR